MPTPCSRRRSAATAGKPSGAFGSCEVSIRRMPQSPTCSTRRSGRSGSPAPRHTPTGSRSTAGPTTALWSRSAPPRANVRVLPSHILVLVCSIYPDFAAPATRRRGPGSIVASVGRRLRKRPVLASVLATAIAAIAVLVIAWVTGAEAVGKAFDDVQPEWIALIAGAEVITYLGYTIAYRSIARVHGHTTLALPLVARVVAAGFGPFALTGGFGIDKQALHALHQDERSARVQVIGLGILEWALLAPTTCVVAIV